MSAREGPGAESTRLRKTIKRIRSSIRRRANPLLAAIASSRAGRRLINMVYRRTSYRWRSALYLNLAKVFRETERHGTPGTWTVDFAGKQVVTPLKAGRFWLDWDFAVGILGHDWEVKRTYSNLLLSSSRPDVFVDVGANFGGHSLLFLVHGIETISVEPNPACHDYIREICALNGVTPRLEPVALGQDSGSAKISFPESETWLGTTKSEWAREFSRLDDPVVTVEVEQKTLDQVLEGVEDLRVIMKIDAEGSEVQILEGARRSIERLRPLIVFESAEAGQRPGLASQFDELRYRIARIPWRPEGPRAYLEPSQFVQSGEENFIAVPVESSNLSGASTAAGSTAPVSS